MIEYLIDGNDRRIGKKVNGQLVSGFVYEDDLSPVAELDGSNRVVSRFVYGTRVNVPDYIEKGGKTYRIVTDHLGSVRLVVDTSDGTIAQKIEYDEFGRVLSDSNAGFQPFGFAGGLYEPLTGLTRFGARDYDSISGRWTAKDPIGFEGGINFYAYVVNDPINFVDHFGYAPLGVPPPETGYKSPKTWNGKKVKNPNGSGSGYPAKDGKVWVPTDHKGTHAPHWDVEDPKTGTHEPVYPPKENEDNSNKICPIGIRPNHNNIIVGISSLVAWWITSGVPALTPWPDPY